MAKIICFGNQKGGVGKSQLTTIFGNYLMSLGFEVCTFDCDNLQGTIHDQRQLDQFNEDFDPNKVYPVIHISSKDLPTQIIEYMDLFDYILLDLPGNLMQEGVIPAYFLVDQIFVPTTYSPKDIDSSIKFLKFYESQILNERKKLGLEPAKISVVLNKIVSEKVSEFNEIMNNRDSFVKTKLDERFEGEHQNYMVHKNYLMHVQTYDRNYSTYKVYSHIRTLRDDSIGTYTVDQCKILCEELFEHLNEAK